MKTEFIKAVESTIVELTDHIGVLELFIQRNKLETDDSATLIIDRVTALKKRLHTLRALKTFLLDDGVEAY